MAWLKKLLSKPRYLLIVGLWNALSVYIGTALAPDPATLTFINTVGNLIIVWLGVEGNHEQG